MRLDRTGLTALAFLTNVLALGGPMRQLVECVPNFSEGRDAATIEAIAAAIRSTPGCTLLDVDPGRSTNRTVYTFVADVESVVEGALAAARAARERIDMRRHSGEHPRIGAMDVCPFVPVSGVSMEDCVACANAFGQRLGTELAVPVFLYGAAARADHRRTLQQIRVGEYEGLAARIVTREWVPDYGPAALVPEWGATAVGARDFLIAYNVNILGTKEQAHRIALDVREQGRGPAEPGALKSVRAIGWWVEEYGLAQVSMNLEDFKTIPPHAAFEACVEAAAKAKVAVAGSELVGLIPREALILAAEHCIARENLFILDERQKIRLAVDRLGLSSIQPFIPEKRIIEYMVPKAADEPLVSMGVRPFVELLASRTPTPGGGSASALAAALGAALGAMVGWMTYGKRRFEDKEQVMRRLIPTLHEAVQALLPLVDRDAQAFDDVMSVTALPGATPDEQAARQRAKQQALVKAVAVPLDVMRVADRCWDVLAEMAVHGNAASRSDLEVGARLLAVGIWGASRNVAINLESVEDAGERQALAAEADALAARAEQKAGEILAVLRSR